MFAVVSGAEEVSAAGAFSVVAVCGALVLFCGAGSTGATVASCILHMKLDRCHTGELKENRMEDTKIQWHAAFVSAMNLELAQNRSDLIYHKEYNLNTKPLEVDLLVIKKEADIQITNEIGKLFRGTISWNTSHHWTI